MAFPTRRDVPGSIAVLAAAGVVFLVALLTHYEVLTYWFTGSDTLTLIEKSRMRTPAEAWKVLSSPLMYGTNFSIVVALFYRPVANLSYALDFWLWGTDPFGYHLTDLLSHAFASVLAFVFIRRVSRDTLIGALAGCLFALHPITAEVVPTPARRHDVLAAIFVLLALLAFIAALRTGRSREKRWLLLAGSVLSYLLAVGAKEVGVIAAPLVGTWFALVALDRGYNLPKTLWRGAKLAIPYAIATFAYLWWRLSVLGGLGGYRGGPWKTSDPLIETAAKYVLSLVYPVDLAGWLFSIDLRLVPGGLYIVLVGAGCLFAYALVRVEFPKARTVVESESGRLVVMTLSWLVVLGAVFALFGRYSIRSGYLALVPTAALLSVTVVTTGRTLARKRRGVDLATVAAFSVTAALVCSLLFVSPLVYPYDEWDHAGEVASTALPAAANAYESSNAPRRAVVAIAGIPKRPGAPSVVAPRPQARTIAYFYANTVASWIRLTHPESEVATYVGGPSVSIGEEPVSVNATLTRTADRRHYRLRFRYSAENATLAAGR